MYNIHVDVVLDNKNWKSCPHSNPRWGRALILSSKQSSYRLEKFKFKDFSRAFKEFPEIQV
jgi:hypothetical protein